MSDGTASLNCRCGACRITLCDPNMRFRTECLCCDCRQRGLISASKRAGNELPAAVANYVRGIDLYYFSNVLLVEQSSRNRLAFFKLREDAFNTTAITTCCGTLMCGVHPVYDGHSISVNADSCRVTVPAVMPIQSVLFGCDIPAEGYAALLHRDDIPKVFSVYEEIDTAPIKALLNALTAPVAESFKLSGHTTFEALCAEKTYTLDNSYFDESRSGKPTIAVAK